MTRDSDTWIWSEERARASKLFDNHALRDSDEAKILPLFNTKPWVVREIIDTVAEELQHGSNIAWPWAVVASRCARHNQDTIVIGPSKRANRIECAKAYVRTALVYLPSEAEAKDDLFGDRGPLREWANDDQLVEEMLDLWRSEKPRGIEAERKAAEWQEGIRLATLAARELKARQAKETTTT